MKTNIFRLIFVILISLLAVELYINWSGDVGEENYTRSLEGAYAYHAKFMTQVDLSTQIRLINRAINKYYNANHKLPKSLDDFNCIERLEAIDYPDNHCNFVYSDKAFFYEKSGYWIKVTPREVDYRLVIECEHTYQEEIAAELLKDFDGCKSLAKIDLPYELAQ